MASLLERIRGLPQRYWAAGAGVFAVVLLVVTLLVTGGEADPAVDDAATLPPAETSSTRPVDTAPTSTIRDGSPTSTTSSPVRDVVAPPGQTGVPYTFDIDVESPALAGRTIPDDPPDDEPPPVTLAPPPWAASTRVTESGHVSSDVGCVDDLGVESIDRFFSQRVGPVIGWDYQHVYPLGGDRYLWLFQDAFIDHTGTKTTLGTARFVHNIGMVQDGTCFSLLHRGSASSPLPFEVGDGTVDTRTKWLWPMGGELVDDRLYVFWAEMIKDPYDPDPPDGLGWHPRRVLLGTYDADTLTRLAWETPRNDGAVPIYGYAVSSDEQFTYLFGNTFEQNLIREGGFWNGPHSATKMYLARVPLGKITEWPQYRTADGWSWAPEDAVPIVERYYAENPMQPRYLDGQWVSVTAVDGYWGDSLAIDVAADPWGPWMTVQYGDLLPRNADPKMNTYHAHLLPWRDGFGSLQITVSNNARNMLRDAWPHPHRYRPMVIWAPFTPTPPPPTTTTSTTTTSTTPTPSTTTSPPTSTTTPSTTTTATTSTSTSTTTTSTSSTTTTTTSSTTSTTTTSTAPPSTTSPPTSTATTSTSSTTTTVAGDDTGTGRSLP